MPQNEKEAPAAQQEMSFEEAMGKLEALVRSMENGNTRLEDVIASFEEARRLSGKEFFGEIMGFFVNSGVGAFAITRGAHAFFVWSSGRLFMPRNVTELPVSAKVDEILAAHPEKRGDTTGCGDNFAGGFASSLLRQPSEGKEPGTLDIYDAGAWAAASGGFAIFTVGGTYLEKKKGEKQAYLKDLRDAYMLQINRI